MNENECKNCGKLIRETEFVDNDGFCDECDYKIGIGLMKMAERKGVIIKSGG
jgi:DNA-directed RNA polymerase subunit RPC12/RpoP